MSTPGQRALAWGVHAYTALGLPIAFAAAHALHLGDGRRFFILLWLATVVDSTDGFLARAVRVKEVLPGFSGRRLDDLIDFINYAFLPALALPALDLLPLGWAGLAVVPLVASGYGFCQEQAKTDDAFVGFPSYWNAVALYLWLLRPPPVVAATSLLSLSALVFVPMHWIYPSRTPLLRPLTIVLSAGWAVALGAIVWLPTTAWTTRIAWISLGFPAYYVGLSIVHHWRTPRSAQSH